MFLKILIIIAGLGLLASGVYLLHWLFNAREWVDYYIKKVRDDLPARAPKGSKRYRVKQRLKKQATFSKALKFRTQVIEFLAKDKPRQAPLFIYVIMGSLLLGTLFALWFLINYWFELTLPFNVN